jgi:hypothetical protein
LDRPADIHDLPGIGDEPLTGAARPAGPPGIGLDASPAAAGIGSDAGPTSGLPQTRSTDYPQGTLDARATGVDMVRGPGLIAPDDLWPGGTAPDRGVTAAPGGTGTAAGGVTPARVAGSDHADMVADSGEPEPGGDPPAPVWLDRGRHELTDAQARDLLRETVLATPAGYAFYPATDDARDFAAKVHPTAGYVTLDLHGDASGFYVDRHRLTPEQFAHTLHALQAEGVLELPAGSGVKLLSCETAAGGLSSPAAALARALGVDVIAPDEVVWTTLSGLEIVSPPTAFGGVLIPSYPYRGHWLRFGPDGQLRPLDFDPGYHGGPVTALPPTGQGGRPVGTEPHGPPVAA